MPPFISSSGQPPPKSLRNLTMGTKIVVMNDALTRQIGASLEVYHLPVNLFTVCFIGSSGVKKRVLKKSRNL